MTVIQPFVEDFTRNGGGLPGDPVSNLNSRFDQVLSGVASNLALTVTQVLENLTLAMVTSGTNNRIGEILLDPHTRHRRRASYYVPTGGLPAVRVFFWQLTTDDNITIACQLTLKANGDLDLRNGSISVATGACPMDQWFDVEFDMDGAANQTVWIYTGVNRAALAHASAAFSLTGALTATIFGKEQHGKVAASTGTMYTGYLSEITDLETPNPYTSAVTSTANAGIALPTGLANDASEAISVSAGAAAATGAGALPTVVVGSSAFPTAGAATGVGNDATTRYDTNAPAVAAAATGAGTAPTITLSVATGAAASTGAGTNPTVDLFEEGITNINTPSISASGTAFDATVVVPSTIMEYKLYRRVHGNAVAVGP